MKKIFILLSIAAAFTQSNAQSFSDDFESYTAGSKLGPQSLNWTTWAGTTEGGNADVNVDSTNAHSGTKSIYFSSTSPSGGPQHVKLPFGGVYNTGQFTFETWLKVSSNKTAYLGFQPTIIPAYSMELYMDNGTFYIASSGTVISTVYPEATWFNLKIDINFNTNTWNVYIDGVLQGSFTNMVNQIAFVEFYPINNLASFRVDDVSYTVTPYALPARNGAVTFVDISNGLVGQQRNPSVLVKNLGTSTITSFDLTVSNGATSLTQSVTGISLASLATTTVNITTPVTLAAGNNTYTASISNVNGIATDDDSTDDVHSSSTIVPVQPAVGKKVVVEEATGTWCGWCPRGAVFMQTIAEKYEDYFIGIAVHNDDPMVFDSYDAGMVGLIQGFPSVVVNRGPAIPPEDMEPDFMERIAEAPKATILNGATYDSTSRELKVSLTTTFQENVTGNYRIACVLTEDGVKGTTSGYAQRNYYAGGTAGVMGGYELLSNPVPASQMAYDHVARVITPSFAGKSNAFGGNNTSGQQITHTFTYVLPASWHENKIHIVGLFINPLGDVDNGSSTTIDQAVANGYASGTEIVGIKEVKQEAKFNLSPNPASDQATLKTELEKPANVKLEVYQITGALVASKTYGELSGSVSLPIETSLLEPGIYFVSVTVDGEKSVLKLVRQ